MNANATPHATRNHAFRVLHEALAPCRRLLWLTIGVAAIAQAIGVPLALLTREMIHQVDHARQASSAAGAERAILLSGGLLVGLTIVRGVCQWLQTAWRERLAHTVIADLRRRMFAHLLNLSLGYFDRRRLGSVLVRFVGDAASLRSWVANVRVAVPADLLTVGVVLVALGLLSWPLLLAAIGPPLLVLPVLTLINPLAAGLTRDGRRAQARLSGDIADRLAHIAAVKAARAEAPSIEIVNRRIASVMAAYISRGRLDGWTRAVSATAGSLALCAIGIVGSVLLLQHHLTVADILAAVWLAVLLRAPINRLSQASVLANRARVAAERIVALLEREPEPGRPGGPGGPDDDDHDDSEIQKQPYDGSGMRIRLAGLGWHDRRGVWRVRGLDVTLVGPGLVMLRGDQTAAATLQELILRLRRPHEGRVALDGTSSRKLRLPDIRQHIGWLDRERLMLPATLATHTGDHSAIEAAWNDLDAIAPGASLRAAMDACDHGFRAPPGADCATLRLALACATTGKRPVLLLDSPTAGLDDSDTARVAGWLRAAAADRLLLVASDDPRLETLTGRDVTTIVLPPPVGPREAAEPDDDPEQPDLPNDDPDMDHGTDV